VNTKTQPPVASPRAGFLILALPALIAGCGQSRDSSGTSSAEPAPVRAQTLADALTAARPGDAIVLPAGLYEAGVKLPSRVSLRGAGYRKTILDARKAEVGVAIEGGEGSELADLTVWGAGKTGVLVAGARRVALRRLRTTGGLAGINFADVIDGRMENVISDENRYGIVVSGGRGNAVVNCTLVQNSSIGLSLPSGDGTVAFNNCIVDGATGVDLGERAQQVHLDHNLYFTPFVGKMSGQLGRRTLGDWRSLSSQDAHSVQLPVTFRDPALGDYRAAGTLSWSLERAPTADWGTAVLAGVKAPESDIDGTARAGRPDAGAFEVAPPATLPRGPDGIVTVRSDAGLKSAGVFARGGRAMGYLFHNLPLPAGPYPFWLPTRDFEGKTIAPGTYDLRTVESALSWEYVGWAGDTGAVSPPSKTAAGQPSWCAFDGAGRLIVSQGWSEDATNLRAYDAANGRWLWAFGGSSDVHGIAAGDDDSIFMLRQSGTGGLITRIDPATGRVVRRSGDDPGSYPFEGGGAASGMAVLGGRLYVADPKANVIRYGAVDPPALDRTIALAGPESLTADRASGRLWAISRQSRVVALDPEGKLLADITPVEAPAALAARDGRLAVASRRTGKVHLFDARDPRALVPQATIGTGDGPFGPYQSDRFLFQQAPGAAECDVSLALGPRGELAVTDENRLLVFDAQGQNLWTTFGLLGDACCLSFAEPGRVFTRDGRKSIRLVAASGTWSPDAFWDVPRGQFLGAFASAGKTFGVFVLAGPDQQHGPLLVVRYDDHAARPVLLLRQDPATGQYLAQKDTNHDGRIDDHDGRTVMTLPRGIANPLRGGPVAHRVYSTLQPSGDVVALDLHADTWGVIWRHGGLDAEGVPLYRLEDCRALARRRGGYISGYTGRPDDSGILVAAVPDANSSGGFTGLLNDRRSPWGTGLIPSAGTDLVCFDGAGATLWDHPLAEHKGVVGLERAGPLLLSGVGATCEILVFNHDGLGLGSFGFPPQVHYLGFFLDQPGAVRAYRGGDGRIYTLVADSSSGMQHWYRLHGEETIVTASSAISLKEPAARQLAALSAPPGQVLARPRAPTIRIPRLAADLPIDGNLDKWRTAGIAPQIVVTPETAAGAVDGPLDVSAVVRLAYRGDALYLQALVFDDVPSFHQPVTRHDRQDGLELCINGFLPGFRFDITRTIDAGPIVLRQRYYYQNLDFLIPPSDASRIIQVLKDARGVPERRLIESIYGVDMAKSPVIVAECKLPIDAATYRDSLAELFPLKPGQAFRLGVVVNDNDQPGSDVHNYLVWPATYGNFNPVDDMAIAVLE
jgi:hypothetical protein